MVSVSPVLLDECIEGLNIKPEGKYVDCTVGGAGHSKVIASKLSGEGILIGLIGSAIPLGLLNVMYGKICTYIASKFSFIGNMMTFIPTKEIFSTLVPIALILGVGIGFLGSRFTIRKHLRV